ncbi:MAG: class I SAM-dependent methyltransferase [Proteobacteria bacterium]|nr:class I SAM-dependent methyltransferase [Pseudomonadota bacterium]
MARAFQDRSVDDVRAYWNARPCNIRHSPKPLGTKEYFDEVEQRKYFVEPHIPGFAEFPSWAGKRVLEVGCGIGTDTMNFARAGAKVTAVDLSSESLGVARQRAKVFGLEDRIDFVEANAEQLADFVPPRPYDLVYSFGVLHHTPDPAAALRSLRRYLGPESMLKIMMYYRWSWKVFWLLCTEGRFRFWDLDRIIARSSEAQSGCPVTYSYSRASLGQLLRGTGFEPREMFVDHIFPWRISEYVRHEYRKVWYFEAMPEVTFRWLEQQAGWHLCATAGPR